MRFQYKGKEGINAKILKDIKFPIDFDAFELCTPALQEKLLAQRALFKESDDAEQARLTRIKEGHKDDVVEKQKLVARPYSFKDGEFLFWFYVNCLTNLIAQHTDYGSNNSGFYTLQAVLTHQGRSSSSGHYVGWVRHKSGKWMKFDDDVVSPIETEDVLRLSGGGDWHCAYVLLYGPRILELPIAAEAVPMDQ